MNISIFMAAICRDLAEGGSGTAFFGSLGSFAAHRRDCIRAGLIGENGLLTEDGRRLGVECRDIRRGRAYFHSDAYNDAIRRARADQ